MNICRYDLKVIKTHLIPMLVEEDDVGYVIKKGNSYMSITTKKLHFLDAVFYIAPGLLYRIFSSLKKKCNFLKTANYSNKAIANLF